MYQGTVKRDDKRYPELLKEINSPPLEINYIGEWNEDIFDNCLAVVGSRRMTSYGKTITEKLVTEIALAGITIVSGFMYGIDAEAHRAAVNVGGKTIAVMPCGADIIHPAYQDKLYNDILKNSGLIISEFEEGYPPDKWTYPKRNRIVAGLSKVILVVEAGEKSGTLITANFAKKFNRKVFSVPGPLTSLVSKGTADLIKEGANIVTSANDIISYYNLNNKNSNQKEDSSRNIGIKLVGLEKDIFEILRIEPVEANMIARKLNIPFSKIGISLSMLQLKNIISEKEGKYHLNNISNA